MPTTDQDALAAAIARVPAGAWAVGVSGGADSVALLLLLAARTDLSLHVAHLDHQIRGALSTGDAVFVDELAQDLDLPCIIGRRDQIEPNLQRLPRNPSARWRAIRLAFFRQIVTEKNLQGVLLAHHADDQAETILLRLLRGSSPAGLAGIRSWRQLDGMTVIRPLLQTPRQKLRDFLQEKDQTWRHDASNESDKYARNRARDFLSSHPQATQCLLELGKACGQYTRWIRASAPKLPERFAAVKLAGLPGMLARQSAKAWLAQRGVPPDELTPGAAQRLCDMAADAATPPRLLFPASVHVRRSAGFVSATTVL